MKPMQALLKRSDRVVSGALRAAGYRRELRRTGDSKIGLWRKRYREAQRSTRGTCRRFVLVPGFGDSPLTWIGVVALMSPVLRRKFDEVVVLDFPGFQGSLARESCFESVDSMRKAVHDALDSLKPQTLMGHSLGGWLSADYAIECGRKTRPSARNPRYSGPELVILAAPSGVSGSEESRKKWMGKFEHIIRTKAFEPFRRELFGAEPFWFRFVADGMAEFLCREDTIQFLKSIREDHFLDQRVKDIASDVWVIWGERDILNPAEWIESWTKLLEGRPHRTRALLLKGVGHGPHVEKPVAISSAIAQILLGREPHEAVGRWMGFWHAPKLVTTLSKN